MLTATTVYNEATLSLLAKVSVRKYRLQCYALSAALLVAGTLLNALSIQSLWYNLLLIALCLFYLLRPHFYYKKLLKRYLTREREVYSTPRTVKSTFEEDKISSHTLNNDSTLTMQYSVLTTLYENKDYLLLMTEGKQGLPIEKTQIEGGNDAELIAFLKTKAPKMKHRNWGVIAF